MVMEWCRQRKPPTPYTLLIGGEDLALDLVDGTPC